jgi:hypothetical protein
MKYIIFVLVLLASVGQVASHELTIYDRFSWEESFYTKLGEYCTRYGVEQITLYHPYGMSKTVAKSHALRMQKSCTKQSYAPRIESYGIYKGPYGGEEFFLVLEQKQPRQKAVYTRINNVEKQQYPVPVTSNQRPPLWAHPYI